MNQTRSIRRRLTGTSTLTLAALMAMPAAYAQQGEPEEILVTARQRVERLVDVPASITVLTDEWLRTAGVDRAKDFIALTPGVSLVNAAEVGDTQVNIRGINGARDAENSFAFIIDGVLYTNPAAFNREFMDLQQIEVVKGPQGAIYGRNAAAGAIIVTTKRPSKEMLEGGVRGTIANHKSYFVSGTMAGPVVKDKLAVRLSADYRSTDGFYRNTFLQKNAVDDLENYNIQGRVLWTPTEKTTVDLKARYGKVTAGAIAFNAAFELPALQGFLGPTVFEDVNDHEFVFQPNIDPLNEQKSREVSIKLDHDMDWATLTTWFLYSDIDQFFSADGTSGAFGFYFNEPSCVSSVGNLFAQGFQLPPPQFLGPIPGFSFLGPYTPTTCDGYQFQVRNQRDFSFEARLASPGNQRLRWLGGIYYLNIDRQVGVAQLVDDGTEPLLSLINARTDQIVNDNFKSNVYAVFGQLAFDVTPQFELAAALRFDREERKVRSLVPTNQLSRFIDFDGPPFLGGAPLNPGLNPVINPSGRLPDQEKAFEQLQPKITATWKVTDTFTAYANWGIGFKSGGFNNQGSRATVDLFINGPTGGNVQIQDQFKKEKSSAFEAGFRTELFDGRVSLEGAGYYTNVDDMQFFEFFVGPFGLLRVVTNIDEVRIIGGEVGMRANLFEGFDVNVQGNITRSEIKENRTRPDTVGNKSPYTPDYTINVGAQYRLPLGGSGLSVLSRVDYTYLGPTWFHTVQAQQRPTILGLPGDYSKTQRDAYGIVNLRVGLEGNGWSITGFVENLADKKYLEEVIPAPEFGGAFIHPGSRRLYGFELNYRF